jgi:hypothetical protein
MIDAMPAIKPIPHNKAIINMTDIFLKLVIFCSFVFKYNKPGIKKAIITEQKPPKRLR